MSERKSAEVKFRCTPTFKAELATRADDAGQSMSEYIEEAVWARQNVDNAIASLYERGAGESGAMQFLRTNVGESQRPVEARESEIPLLDVVECDKSCRPWEFCACKAGAEDTA